MGEKQKCQFDPENPLAIIPCKKTLICGRKAIATGFKPAEVAVLVCDTDDNTRAAECAGFNDIVVHGNSSEHAALDPNRLPG